MHQGYGKPCSALFPISYLLMFTPFFMFSIIQFTMLFFKEVFEKLHRKNVFGRGEVIRWYS